MNYVFILGTEECAPNCIASSGETLPVEDISSRAQVRQVS